MVLDTQMWIWLSTGSQPVPSTVLAALQSRQTEPCLSATSVWEVAMLIEKGRIGAVKGPRETMEDWLQRYPLRIIPIDSETALLSRTLAFAHEDPADRFIAATAHRLGVPLATSDARLLALPWLKTLS